MTQVVLYKLINKLINIIFLPGHWTALDFPFLIFKCHVKIRGVWWNYNITIYAKLLEIFEKE